MTVTSSSPEVLMWLPEEESEWQSTVLLPHTSRLTVERTDSSYIIRVREDSVFAEVPFQGAQGGEKEEEDSWDGWFALSGGACSLVLCSLSFLCLPHVPALSVFLFPFCKRMSGWHSLRYAALP